MATPKYAFVNTQESRTTESVSEQHAAYRTLITDVAENLRPENITNLAYHHSIEVADPSETSAAINLLKKLEEKGIIGPTKTSSLCKVLKDIHRDDLNNSLVNPFIQLRKQSQFSASQIDTLIPAEQVHHSLSIDQLSSIDLEAHFCNRPKTTPQQESCQANSTTPPRDIQHHSLEETSSSAHKLQMSQTSPPQEMQNYSHEQLRCSFLHDEDLKCSKYSNMSQASSEGNSTSASSLLIPPHSSHGYSGANYDFVYSSSQASDISSVTSEFFKHSASFSSQKIPNHEEEFPLDDRSILSGTSSDVGPFGSHPRQRHVSEDNYFQPNLELVQELNRSTPKKCSENADSEPARFSATYQRLHPNATHSTALEKYRPHGEATGSYSSVMDESTTDVREDLPTSRISDISSKVGIEDDHRQLETEEISRAPESPPIVTKQAAGAKKMKIPGSQILRRAKQKIVVRPKSPKKITWTVKRNKLNKAIYEHKTNKSFQCPDKLELDVQHDSGFNLKLKITLGLYPYGLEQDANNFVTLRVDIDTQPKKAPKLNDDAKVRVNFQVSDLSTSNVLEEFWKDISTFTRESYINGFISHKDLKESKSDCIGIRCHAEFLPPQQKNAAL